MKKWTTTSVGGFVVGAIAIVAFGIIFFGKTNFFTEQVEYVMYFSGSVDGLKPGSPVTFRGVNVGEVIRVKLLLNTEGLFTRIPVIVKIFPDKMDIVGDYDRSGKLLDKLIQKGLRAQLDRISILTGQMGIELSLQPDTPIKMMHKGNHYLEIPTIKSNIQEITDNASKIIANLSEVDFVKFAETYTQLAKNINTFIQSQSFQQAVNNFSKSMLSMEKTLKKTPALTYQISKVLRDISQTANSIRSFTGFMERQPQSVVWGKKTHRN